MVTMTILEDSGSLRISDLSNINLSAIPDGSDYPFDRLENLSRSQAIRSLTQQHPRKDEGAVFFAHGTEYSLPSPSLIT
jgi:hypothetical protein